MTQLSPLASAKLRRLAFRLRAAWRAAAGPAPLDAHLAADTGLPGARMRPVLNPMIGAWLR